MSYFEIYIRRFFKEIKHELNEFNYLSLNQNNDQKEPLISENQINLNDSSNIVENLKTLTHCETKQLYEEDINNNANNIVTKT